MMERMTSKSYKEIRPDLKTGDIVLFSGKGVFSKVIKLASKSKWSHVGMIVKVEGWDFVLLWESTTLNTAHDIDAGKRRKGVQIVALSQRLDKYKGEIGVRHLNGVELNSDDITKLQELRLEVMHRPYERNMVELVGSVLGSVFNIAGGSLGSLFCSELVAEVYRRIGLLEADVKPNSFTPHSFSNGNLKLRKGSLSEIINITKPII